MAVLKQNDLFTIDDYILAFSIKELQSIRKKVAFYVDHYSAVKKGRQDDITYEDKINFLSNLNKALDQEIQNRQPV
ncbi:MAG TPA: hypothetical protein P5556_06395 [Candidatus Gastranaerophilales bacterium]|nr:hypothetical protein [Candidatus Gastranaerophilales bacterium]